MEKQVYWVRVLGGFALEKPTGELELSLSRPRALAVLAVLTVAGSLGCTRDRLIGLLWSEKDEERARHNLRDAVYAIRTALGSEALTGQGDALHLNPTMVDSDVYRFTTAMKEGRHAEAIALYAGPLLDGFHIDEAPEFERWLDGERTHLLRERQQAAKQLAREAEQEEHWDAAAGWWARAVEVDPCNSRLVIRRMVALWRAGDRANAIEEGEAHRTLLRVELDIEPDAAFMEMLTQIRDGGGSVQFFTPQPWRPARDS